MEHSVTRLHTKLRNIGKMIFLLVVFGAFFSCVLEEHFLIELVVNSNNSTFGTVVGGGSYYEDAIVKIQAIANVGYGFVRWDDNNTKESRLVLVPSGGASYTAYFEKMPPAPITVVPSDLNGTVSGGGTFEVSSKVTISATPKAGYRFLRWSDNNIDPTRTIRNCKLITHSSIA